MDGESLDRIVSMSPLSRDIEAFGGRLESWLSSRTE